MFNDPTLTLADQVFWIVDVFLKTLAPEACKRRVGVLSGALWNRVRRLEGRFRTLYGMWKAGTLPAVRVRTSPRRSRRSGAGEGDAGAAMSTRPASLLPRGLRWMQGMLPLSAGALASGLRALLDNHPEMKAFVAECPQVGRVLRPLCRMAGLQAPEWLARPRRKRGSSPRPSRGEGDARGRRRTAREVARAAIERSERTGKPVDPRRIGAVVYGYVLHWPRDDNCPPPEIGYGGRSFPPLPKDYVRPDDGEG